MIVYCIVIVISIFILRLLLLSLLFSLFLFTLRCFDFTLKSGTFSVPGLVLPGRGTAWHKSGISREIRNGWQPYSHLGADFLGAMDAVAPVEMGSVGAA